MLPKTILLTGVMVLGVALAGCVEDADQNVTDEPETQDADLETTVLPWGFEDCTWVVAAVPTEATGFEGLVPDGYTLMTPEEMGLPPVPGADAVMGLEAFDCATGHTLNGTVGPMAYSAYWAPVHPPENLSREGAGLQFLKWDVLIPDEPRRTMLQGAGIPAVDGSVDLSGFMTTPAGYTFTIPFTLGGDSHTFDGSANGAAPDAQKNFTAREFTPMDNGTVLWDTRVVSPDMMQGSGTVQLASGSLPARVIGADAAQTFFLAGTSASFVEGSIELPPGQGIVVGDNTTASGNGTAQA